MLRLQEGKTGGAAACYRVTRAKHNGESTRFGGWWGVEGQDTTKKKTTQKHDQGGMMKKCIWP